jgi:hypothetical protein
LMRWNVRDNLTLHCTLELNQLTLGQALEPMHIYVLICRQRSLVQTVELLPKCKMQNLRICYSQCIGLHAASVACWHVLRLDLSSSLYQSKLHAGFIV